jgi:hypothetical protein
LLIDTEKKGLELEQNVAGLARLEDAQKADALAKERCISKELNCIFSEEMQRKV